MKTWIGFFEDTFIRGIEAETEEEAQKLAKDKLLELIKKDDEPFSMWEEKAK